MKTYHIIISGKVQGVSFRASTHEIAIKHNISGFVRNMPTSEVEIICQGSLLGLKQFIDWCKTGPKYANIDKINVNEIDSIKYDDFKIIETE